jgi:hypothetical protein
MQTTMKAQKDCDSLSFKVVQEFNTYTPAKFEKLIRQKKQEPLKAFDAATYLRQKNDSSYIKWYEVFLKSIKDNRIDIYTSGSFQYRIGKAWYFLGDYHLASIYLSYTRPGSCENNYFNDSFSKLSKDTIDWFEIIASRVFEKVNEVDSTILSKFPNWKNQHSVTQPLGDRRYPFVIARSENYWIVSYGHNYGRFMDEECFFIKKNADGSVLIYTTERVIHSIEQLKTDCKENKLVFKKWNYFNY